MEGLVVIGIKLTRQRRNMSSIKRIIVKLRYVFIIFTCIIIFAVLWENLHSPTLSDTNWITRDRSENFAHNKSSISLFVRMTGRLKHRTCFYCFLFRTAVLFWPSTLGKIVITLDAESAEDHKFAGQFKNQTKKHFPDYDISFHYEPLPKNKTVLQFAGSPKSPGYNRQIWSSFFIDLYSNDDVIAWMDSDVLFAIPVTHSTIFQDNKVRVLGTSCRNISWIYSWAKTTERAIGCPWVADFMTYFPVYIYRDTITHCRQHILKRFNTNNFEEAFQKFYHTSTGLLSPVSVILNYAWHFEKERYDWNLKVFCDINTYNDRFPPRHKITPNDAKVALLQPQTAAHGVRSGNLLLPIRNISFCLSQSAAGNNPDICRDKKLNITEMLLLFNDDFQSGRTKKGQTQCTGKWRSICLKRLEDYHKEVGREIAMKKRKCDWNDFNIVRELAKDVDIVCPPHSD